MFNHTLFEKKPNNRDLTSSEVFRSINWELVSNISAKHIGPIFKSQGVKEDLGLLDP
jgi:hypothetical protein